jgi:thiamine biosynthesis protein ThiI
MYSLILVRFGEIGIKGKNRSDFERKLVENIVQMLKGMDVRVMRADGRIWVRVGERDNYAEVIERLRFVPGIVSVSPVREVPLDLEEIKKSAVEIMQRLIHTSRKPVTFKVESRRANKQFPLSSPEIARTLGGHLLRHIPDIKVDVHEPDLVLWCEVRANEAYIYSEVIPGPGGLPVGASGRVLLLLSGGIDSPVAGWMALKRGAELEAIHFHSFPFTSERARQKVEDLAKILARYAGKVRLHVVHFTEVQKAIRQHCPEELSITIMRRFMFRIADRIAHERKALALVTGESLGQVASQTLESMYTINHVTTMPVLRPLVALDKTEIMRIAKEIGTYETSILPYEDCCTIFLPKSPKTRPRVDEAIEAEQKLDIESLVKEAVEKTETVVFQRETESF